MSAVVHFHMIYSFGKVVAVYYLQLVGGDAERAKKSKALWSQGCVRSSGFTADVFCRGRGRTSAARCAVWVSVVCLFVLSLFIHREGFWEHKHLFFFQQWIKFDSQPGCKMFIVFFKRNDLCKMIIVCKCKTSVKVCLYECLHKYLSLCRNGGEGL